MTTDKGERGKIIMQIFRLPGPEIKGLNVDKDNCVEFSWWNKTYRVTCDPNSHRISVDEVDGSMLGSGPIPTLIKELLFK